MNLFQIPDKSFYIRVNMSAVNAKIWVLFLYFALAEGLLDNVNGGIPDTSTLLHLQTLTEELLRVQRDIVDLKQSNADLKQSNAAMMNELAILKSKDESVAFFAYLTNDVVDPPVGTTLVFARTETNVGNAYDSTHGVFVAPVNGTYHFTFTTSVAPSPGHGIHLFMMQNGKNEMYVFLDGNTQSWLQRGSSRVLHLTRGDRIWIEVGGIAGHNTIGGYRQSDGSYHTHFSGFLIHAD